MCSGYSSVGFGKLDVWQVKYVRDYFLLNKGKPKFPHAFTKLLRGEIFNWTVANTIKPTDGNNLVVKDYKKFLDDIVQYVIKEPIDFDTAKTLINGEVNGAKKKKSKKSKIDDDESEEFRVA